MSLFNLSVKQLEHAVELLKERENLQSKLDEVNRQLQHLENGRAHIPIAQDRVNDSANSPRLSKRLRRRRKLQPSILKALNAAGAKGLSVKELAARIKTNPASLSVWLYTTGKKITGLKKVAPGIFAYASP
jgi:hypothetical protein